MKVLILGARGMLAQDLAYIFKKEKPILWDKEELDITNQTLVEKKIKEAQPEIVINAAAYTDVEGAEKNKETAFQINAEAVGYLAEAVKNTNAILVHYSTDYVFGQEKKNGYTEDEKPLRPLNAYGESKLAGEKKILSCRDLKYYLIRTAWLFGPSSGGEYKNFIRTILRLAQEKEKIRVVNDQWGKPTYTLDLAQATYSLLSKKMPFGIYHLTNESKTTWYELAREIGRIKGFKEKIFPCQSKEYPTLAKRPRYAVLINSKGPCLRNWKEALKEYLANL